MCVGVWLQSSQKLKNNDVSTTFTYNTTMIYCVKAASGAKMEMILITISKCDCKATGRMTTKTA